MRHGRQFGQLGAAVVVCLTGLFSSAHADEVVIGRLTASADGGMHAANPMKIKLLDVKPAGITKEPVYLHVPLYGMITMGDAKESQIAVVLDSAPNASTVRVYVDANGNGDLTDDPTVALMPMAVAGAKKAAIGAPAVSRLGAHVKVDARYKSGPGMTTVVSGLTVLVTGMELAYNRDYSRTGKLTIGTRVYRMALIDQAMDGRYGNYKHEAGQPAKVSLLIDRNGNGEFDLPGEANDIAKPFRLGVGSYEVATIDNKGTTISLKRSMTSAKETMAPSDMLVGGDCISFDTETTAGKKVSFPADYKGRVVLLDFWAVWCPPCRAEVPNIVQVYNLAHPEGFDMLGISLDKAGDKQVLADYTMEQGMTWPEVFDGGFWMAEIAQLYGVESIPHSLLVDGDTGQILAMGDKLRGDGLATSVAKALALKKK